MTSTILAVPTPAAATPAVRPEPAVRTVVRRLPDFDATAGSVQAAYLPPPAPVPVSIPAPRQPELDAAPPAQPDPAREPNPADQPADLASDRARVHAHMVLRQVLEVLDGRRPAAQIAGLVSESVLGYVLAVAGRLDDPGLRRPPGFRRRTGVPRAGLGERTRAVGLRSMRVCHPAAGVAEISVVWRHRGRFRALAARFEQSRPDALDSADLDAPDQDSATLDASEPALAEPGNAELPWRCTALRVG
jgi:hypothetical protein